MEIYLDIKMYLGLSTEMPFFRSAAHMENHDEFYGNRQLPS